jgi:hypothetical protein
MKISIIERSRYFKGLLLLIKSDRSISESEIALMKRIGKSLGFEKEFCENTINSILENEFITDEMPVFSSRGLAEKFIKDGLFIAFSDNEVHPKEVEWLRLAAEKNTLEEAWFSLQCNEALKRKAVPMHLEADELIVN